MAVLSPGYIDGVDKVRAEIAEVAPDWAMITALLGGTSAMRCCGKTYLPQGPAEPPKVYNFRLNVCATLFNGFQKSVDTMSGKPFSEPIKLGADVPQTIVDYCEDIDLEGRNLQAFAHDVFRTAIAYGLSHILVDYPETPEAITLAEQKESGVRSYFCHIRPWQILGWRSQKIAGAETLTQLRILESAVEDVGQWGVVTVPQIRVLYPDRFELYRKRDKKWVRTGGGPVSLGAIPLATVYTGRTGFMTARAPMLDLAHLNVEHWRSTSEQVNILHVARVPILFASGFSGEDELKIGSQNAVKNEFPDAKLQYVEHTGKAIEAGRQSIKDLEDQMRVLGAQLLVPDKSINKTATEKSSEVAESDAPLSLAALSLQDSLELAFSFIAKWEKLPTGGEIEVYRDFDEPTSDASRGDILMKGKQEGAWSAQTTFEEAQRLGVISETRTWDDELARFSKEGAVVGITGNYIAPPTGATAPPSGNVLPMTSQPKRAVTKKVTKQSDGGYLIEEQA